MNALPSPAAAGNSTGAGRLALQALAVAGLALLAALPWLGADDYLIAVGINILQYGVLATAWALFSGPTRYVSLATVAFFGIGAYTAAVFGETLPWPAVLAAALGVSLVLALIVGLATLRLSGVHFVIFTFGLAELVHQLVNWYEVNVTRTLGRYLFVDISQVQIYWQLLALLVAVLATGWAIRRSRLGLALQVIGDDEVVARHVGIDTTRAKLLLFAISAGFIGLAGAAMAPRWTYIDPAIAFNPVISFQVLIMALLGGANRLFGPLLGVLPVALLFELLSGSFPNHFMILLGLVFMAIVYFIPNGLFGLLERRRQRAGKEGGK
ncbi:branched-chain amino acid ABC transporter permease [Azoarcus indigens]|uniref:Amino acid/amide ABC transporter membrane protein 2 (HAAT family) n=1 Tax=Azoarcus indigens TaxID=29545 RepID=A0A4R6DL24_9RHOO|nr:branched-chain amino acid ABC transporter permease [Azoarcus indigens]NMG66156.1 branched-chain amino acid ABC transporter permease [Azoarcus indigens]TDN45575.1 amino acid/amide ABC transporter membrane protein 2 (HAAT family) [Azoarcus indigens]